MPESDEQYALRVMSMCREKVNTLSQLYDFSYPFFFDDYVYEQKFIDEYLKTSYAKDVLENALEYFAQLKDWSIEGTEKVCRSLSNTQIVSKNKVFQLLRGVVTGKLVTPGLFETLSVLGRERVILRIKRALSNF